MGKVKWYPRAAKGLVVVSLLRRLLGLVGPGEVRCLHAASGGLSKMDVTEVARTIHDRVACPRCGHAVTMKAYLAPPGGAADTDILRPTLAFYACIPSPPFVERVAVDIVAMEAREDGSVMSLSDLAAFVSDRLVLCVEAQCTRTTARPPGHAGGKPRTRRCVPSFVFIDKSGNTAVAAKSNVSSWWEFARVLDKAASVVVGTGDRVYKLSSKARVNWGKAQTTGSGSFGLAPMVGTPLVPPKPPDQAKRNGASLMPPPRPAVAAAVARSDEDADTEEDEEPPRLRGVELEFVEGSATFRRNKRSRRRRDDDELCGGVSLSGSALRSKRVAIRT